MTSSDRWYLVWKRALWPSVRSYESLSSSHGNVPIKAAIGWISSSTLISYGIIVVRLFLIKNPFLFENPTYFLLGGPLGILAFGILRLLFFAGIGQWIAHLLGGSGDFRKLIYAFAALLAPLAIISTLVVSAAFVLRALYGFPILNTSLPIFWLPFGIYQIILSAVAVKAIHRFGWVKAAISVLPVLTGAMLFTLYSLVLPIAYGGIYNSY